MLLSRSARSILHRSLTVLRTRQSEGELAVSVAKADRVSLEERRQAIESGELKGTSLADLAEESVIEEEAAAGAEAVPDEEAE